MIRREAWIVLAILWSVLIFIFSRDGNSRIGRGRCARGGQRN